MGPKSPWLDLVYCTESLTAVAMETTLPSSEDTRFRFLTPPLFPDFLMKVQLLVGPELSSISSDIPGNILINAHQIETYFEMGGAF